MLNDFPREETPIPVFVFSIERRPEHDHQVACPDCGIIHYFTVGGLMTDVLWSRKFVCAAHSHDSNPELRVCINTISPIPASAPPPPAPIGFVRVPILRGLYELEHTGLLHEVVARNGIFCGGHVRWMCSPRSAAKLIPSTDIDIYPKDEVSFNILKNLFTVMYALEVRHENAMSITYRVPKSADDHRLACLPPIQLIKPVVEGRIVSHGSMEEILSNFDFSVVRCGFPAPDPAGMSPTHNPQAMVDELFLHDEYRALLRIRNIHCPVSSTYRVIKYVRKGYWIRPMQMLGLFLDWDARPPEYRAKLVEFLRKAGEYDPNHPEKGGLSQQEIDELEALMRID